jgi:hypothetical protein
MVTKLQQARKGYDQRFICSRCREMIFVFGATSEPPPSVCEVCRVETGRQLRRLDKNQWPETFRFSRELRALMVKVSADPLSLQCIYLDENGRSQRE